MVLKTDITSAWYPLGIFALKERLSLFTAKCIVTGGPVDAAAGGE
jgi:hypothetical protein